MRVPTLHPGAAAFAAAAVAVAAVAVVALAASCAGPPLTPAGTRAGAFTLVSPAFDAGGAVPARYTCDGQDVSPPLAWSGAPAGAATFVLLVDDLDANGFVHWVVGPIAPSTTSLPEAIRTDGTPSQGTNGFGKQGWGGPCPPSGTHRYSFRLAALPAGVAVSAGLTAEDARGYLARALGIAELDATYAHP